MIVWSFALAAVFVSAERSLKEEGSGLIHDASDEFEPTFLFKAANFLWQSNQSGYQHVWPVRFVSLYVSWFVAHEVCVLFLDMINWIAHSVICV